MGFKLKKTEVLCLKPNEELELCLKLEHEHRACIHGVVKFENGAPAKNAVVKLFVKKDKDCCDLIPVTFAFTDECGQFLFGVKSGIEYVVKVFWYIPEHHKPHDCHEEKPCHEEEHHHGQDKCDCEW